LLLRRFGFWSAVAALIEWAAIYGLLPILMARRSQGRTALRWVDPERAFGLRGAAFLSRFTIPRALARALLLLPLVGAVGYQQIHFSGSDRMFAPEHPMSVAIDYVARTRGWEAPVYVVFPPSVAATERVALIEKIRHLPHVRKAISKEDALSYLTRDL